MSATITHARSHAFTHAWRGAAAGLVGGVVFGVLMALTGMLPMVAMLVGSESVVAGAIVHLAISAVFGAVFGIIAGAFADRVWSVLGAGLAFGLVLWVLGGLMAMPALLGMAMFPMGQTSMMSLMGHVLYGLVTAAALYGLSMRNV
ncbi:hypothetical protein [Nocardiopsis sp. LOL_012]|uniref:hypothetical protein n=1 Tax=Nocardiopsis sp. LOL_012 TaxID=3345409 RepID=UPI003A8625BF